jgi:hypothetical protein
LSFEKPAQNQSAAWTAFAPGTKFDASTITMSVVQ